MNATAAQHTWLDNYIDLGMRFLTWREALAVERAAVGVIEGDGRTDVVQHRLSLPDVSRCKDTCRERENERQTESAKQTEREERVSERERPSSSCERLCTWCPCFTAG